MVEPDSVTDIFRWEAESLKLWFHPPSRIEASRDRISVEPAQRTAPDVDGTVSPPQAILMPSVNT